MARTLSASTLGYNAAVPVTWFPIRLGVILLAGVLFAAPVPPQSQPTSSLDELSRKALARTSGDVPLAGLQQRVTILRDRWGVPHIYADNQHDLFYAQGYVAAQDRLFQMEVWKRAGQGRLAEILGKGALQRDVSARLLRYRGDMKAEFESYAPDAESILRAFTDGINAYIDALTASGGPGLPVEFQVAGFAPEHWKPEDCLNRMAAYSMTGNSSSELFHAQLIAAVGVEKASNLLDLDPPVMLDPAPGLDLKGLTPSALASLVGSDVRIEFPGESTQGSNNWTISGKLTASGKPLLANDPHRVIALPSLRYIVHLVAPGWDVIGGVEPALPGVALGHNQNIAWGFTIFGLDQQDLYIEELNAADPLQYRTEHGWQKMTIEKETFQIKNTEPETVDLKFTRHGPVLWQDGKRALALRWVGAEPGTAGYLGSLSVDRASNWQEFEAAMQRWKVPSENIVYADSQGNIGEHSTGLAPLRKKWTGLLPVPGNGKYEWSGFVPVTDLPHLTNPRSGFIATANHKTIPDGYVYKVGYEWAPPYRINRIERVLDSARESGKKLNADDMRQLQNDVFSEPARQLLGLLESATWPKPGPVAQMLLDWDRRVRADSAAAGLFEAWVKIVRKATVEKVVNGPAKELLGEWSLALVLEHLTNPKSEFFGEHPRKGRNDLLIDSLEKAGKRMEELQGADPTKWSWGKMHTIRFRHSLDQLPSVAQSFNLGPVERPGDGTTVNATGFNGKSFMQTDGASYREILDTSDWDHSLAVNTPGQSGQPGSPHYSDLLPLWKEGQYFPLLYSREGIEKNSSEKLILVPTKQ
jgi:penicillin G amidase